MSAVHSYSLVKSTREKMRVGGGADIPDGPDMGAPMLRRSSELYALEVLAMTLRAGEDAAEGPPPPPLLSRLSSD